MLGSAIDLSNILGFFGLNLSTAGTSIIAIIQILLGFFLLIFFADVLLKGTIGVSKCLNLNPAFLAFTVIAFGTSLPELTASLLAAHKGSPDISVGNVMGSNIFNLAMVIGVTALLIPISISKYELKFSWPTLFIATFLFLFLGFDYRLGFFDGLIFVIAFISIILFMAKTNKEQGEGEVLSIEHVPCKLNKACFYLVIGLLGLLVGAEFAINGAILGGKMVGMNERVIGLTIVSVGTSLPELFTSVAAIKRGQKNICIANIIGSNIMNTIGITGITALFIPLTIAKSIIFYDLVWVFVMMILIITMTLLFKNKITKFVGAILIVSYIIYMATLI